MDNKSIRLENEKIKKKLTNQDKNRELLFSYLDAMIGKHEPYKPVKVNGFKRPDKEIP